ncbi:MAG: hypothetical protein KDI51_01415 [Xanthomonadales bacterium]|nr:hypothetical protein [Xanthomonadales bacterium]
MAPDPPRYWTFGAATAPAASWLAPPTPPVPPGVGEAAMPASSCVFSRGALAACRGWRIGNGSSAAVAS